jgi:cellobiose-specific phosphotransferase system component IIA
VGLSEESAVEETLRQAERSEKEYDWLGATESYEKALELLPADDFSRRGQTYDRQGHAFYRAAMQAESQEEFRERMQRAIEKFEKAHESYKRLIDKQKTARMFFCEAVVKYLRYWLTSVASEKRKLLDECLELEGKALQAFLESGDKLEYGKTYSELSLVFFCRFYLEWDRQTAESIVKKGVEWGEEAVVGLSELGNSYETARAHFTLATCLALLGGGFIAEPEEMEKNRLKVVKCLSKAAELSEKIDDAHLLGSSHLWWGASTGGEEALKHFEKTLECGKLARDNFLIAWGSDFLAFTTYWEAIAAEDPEKSKEMAEKAMRFYDRAQHHYSIILYSSPRWGVITPPTGHAEYYLNSAGWETEPSKRLEFLEKSERAGMEALKEAEASDMPFIVQSAFHVISKIFEARAYAAPDPVEQRSYLEKALKCRERAIEVIDRLTPFDYWDRGVMQNYLAEIKWLLAEIEPNLDSRRRLLEEAVLSEQRCIELCDKMAPYYERTGYTSLFAALRAYQDSYVTILTRLYDLTNNPEHLRKAIEISQKAIESASKLDMISRIAESYWKMAQTQDILGEHLKAAESFKHASECYVKAAEKIPQLKDFYQDHAGYMHAWNEIEKAKHHHSEKQYGLAREHYEKAADLHNATQRWNYLSRNYLAWAKLEEAEDLSRKEQTEEAKDLFQQAADLFAEAKKSIETKLEKIENKDEKEISINLAKASDFRHEYCLGRIALEEAKILDRQGDHAASSRKYGSASGNFQRAMDAMEYEADRQELKPIVFLCQAWQVMTRAEAEASPDMYKEASRLFEDAKDHSLDEKAKMLALGHSSFCKALEAGTRFEAVRDTSLHTLATQHLEGAANYYLRAGFKNASEYAEATQKLLDAYLYMHNAKTETDPTKKARFYMMAEKVLQASAGSYLKAKHPEKQEQVSSLLEKVKNERELALSLTEVLHAPLATSTTATFTTPTPTGETPTGLERFEHADIQANIITRQKELKVGENLNLEVELVNAGKGPALLIKLAEVVPEGFEIAEKPEIYRVEDSYLDIKGKRLEPLKTEDVRLVLKSKVQGVFPLKPRILYLDENGKAKSHEPEPITITVKELGIKGWLKGER